MSKFLYPGVAYLTLYNFNTRANIANGRLGMIRTLQILRHCRLARLHLGTILWASLATEELCLLELYAKVETGHRYFNKVIRWFTGAGVVMSRIT